MAIIGAAKAPAVPANQTGKKYTKLVAADYHVTTVGGNTYADTAINDVVDLLVAKINALVDHLNDGRR